jgi:carbonic anhydrase/acetyltransferase-like protein (isoleucine patch superfamily)
MNNGMPSLRPNPAGDVPQVDPAAYIDPLAQIIGRLLS